jgi:hypothetical protein
MENIAHLTSFAFFVFFLPSCLLTPSSSVIIFRYVLRYF